MKYKGFKIENKVYFVTEKQIAQHGSLENAAKAVKVAKEKPIEVEKPKKPKAEKVVEAPIESEPEQENVE